MASPIVPFGRLVSFGNFTFPVLSSPLQEFNWEWAEAFTPMTNRRYPFDQYGLSQAPNLEPKATWCLLLTATAGHTGTAAYQDVQDAFNAMMSAFNTDYTYTGVVQGTSVTGQVISGNVGNLVVQDANGSTTHTAWARIVKVETKLAPAKNTYAMEVPLTFMILEDWH
jgi:hypothetical protein